MNQIQLKQAWPELSRVHDAYPAAGNESTLSHDDSVTSTKVKHERPKAQSAPSTTRKLAGRPVRITVGREKNDIYVHEDLLKSSSEYFAAMFEGGWEEAKRGVVVLDDVDPSNFRVYQNFLYFGKVESDLALLQDNEMDKEHERLIECYVLGDRFRDGAFKDCVIDVMHDNATTSVRGYYYYPSGQLTTKIYSSTPPLSPLRRLILDQHVTHGKTTWMSEPGIGAFDKDFLFDLTIALLDEDDTTRKTNKAREIKVCKYHENVANAV